MYTPYCRILQFSEFSAPYAYSGTNYGKYALVNALINWNRVFAIVYVHILAIPSQLHRPIQVITPQIQDLRPDGSLPYISLRERESMMAWQRRQRQKALLTAAPPTNIQTGRVTYETEKVTTHDNDDVDDDDLEVGPRRRLRSRFMRRRTNRSLAYHRSSCSRSCSR